MRIVAVLFALLASGCLGSTYRVPDEDLSLLARTDPATRSQQVRVIQEFSTASEPPRGPRVGVSTGVYIAVGASSSRRVGRSAGGGGRGGARVGGPNVSGAKASADSAAVMIMLAAGAAVGLAVTEGIRYDGWAALHPLHPLHLQMPDGMWVWVPVQELTPELADVAVDAVVRRSEGPFVPLGRAPLNRVGFTYALELGSAGLDSVAGTRPWGFMGRIQFGGFPIQQLGVIGSVGLGWGQNADRETIFNSRYALELHAYPVTAGILSAGTYVQGGLLHSAEDTVALGATQSRTNPMYGIGVLIQLELTTRLALTARGGLTRLAAPEGTHDLGEASLGIAVY